MYHVRANKIDPFAKVYQTCQSEVAPVNVINVDSEAHEEEWQEEESDEELYVGTVSEEYKH